MAEKDANGKKQPKKLSLVKACIIGAGTTIFMGSVDAAVNGTKLIQIGYPKYDRIGQPVVGYEIELNPNAQIYTSYDAALSETNPQNMSYPEAKRIVKTAFYSTSNGDVFVRMTDDNYQQHEQEILDNGGRLVVVLTVHVDNQNEPEGFINVSDIRTDYIIYGPVKK